MGSVAKRRLVHEATLAKELRRALSSSDCRGRSDVRVVFQRELERAKARGLVDTSWGEIDPGLLCPPRRRLRAEPPGHGWPDWDVTWDELLAAIDRLVDGTAPAAALVVGPGGRARPLVRIEARGETLLLDATGPAWRDRARGVRVEAYRELARCGFRSSKDGRLACHPGLPAAAPEERRAAAWLVWHLLSTVYGLSPEERPTVRVAADDGGWPTREAPWREGALLFGGARVAGYTWGFSRHESALHLAGHGSTIHKYQDDIVVLLEDCGQPLFEMSPRPHRGTLRPGQARELARVVERCRGQLADAWARELCRDPGDLVWRLRGSGDDACLSVFIRRLHVSWYRERRVRLASLLVHPPPHDRGPVPLSGWSDDTVVDLVPDEAALAIGPRSLPPTQRAYLYVKDCFWPHWKDRQCNHLAHAQVMLVA